MTQETGSNGGPGALSGYTVLELGGFITGPLCTMLMADLGAEVIKVEDRKGDPFRPHEQGLYSPSFRAFNRNKKSMTLDLRSQEGREIFLQLVERADAVVENFRPGTLDRLGVGYEILHNVNPRLVYLSINGFGNSGPQHLRPSVDAIGQAASGLMSLLVDGDDLKLRGTSFSDITTGIFSAYGLLAGLMARDRYGKGMKVENSMLASTMAFVGHTFTNYFSTGRVFEPGTRAEIAQIFPLKAGDGKLLTIQIAGREKFWEFVTDAIGRPELRDDPRFKTRPDRVKNYDGLHEIFKTLFLEQPRDAWVDLMMRHDVPVSPIYSVDEVEDDPQVQFQDAFISFEHPLEGITKAVKNPILFSEASTAYRMPPPALGDHTEAILAELGYDEERVAALREAQVI